MAEPPASSPRPPPPPEEEVGLPEEIAHSNALPQSAPTRCIDAFDAWARCQSLEQQLTRYYREGELSPCWVRV